jgi:hypothetical protein
LSKDGKYDYLPDATTVVAGWTFFRTSRWQLEFNVENPPRDDVQEKSFKLKIFLDGACADIVVEQELEKLNAVNVSSTAFTKKDIGQSNPCPCSKNVITVTLLTSQPVYAACKPVITIQGLRGSQTPDRAAFPVSENSQSGVVAVGSWMQASGTLVLPLMSNYLATNDLIFSFELDNQAASQASPGISMSIGSMSIGSTFIPVPVAMARDGESLPESGEVIDVAAGDAQPMKIWALRFVEKRIGQSTPFPACINTLTVTLRFNCPIDPVTCPAYVRISNLVDNSTASHSSALVTPEHHVRSFQNPTGKLSLTGVQHLVLNPTRTESWWAPGLCGDARMAAGDWCETCEPANGACTLGCSPGFGYWEDGYVDCLQVAWEDPPLPTHGISNHILVRIDNNFGGAGFAANYSAPGRCVHVTNHGRGYTSGGLLRNLTNANKLLKPKKGTFSVGKRLTLWVARKLSSNSSHVFQFQITNPIKQQRSPEILIESKVGMDRVSSFQFVQDTSLQPGSTTVFAGKPGKCSMCAPDYSVPMDKDGTTVLCCTSCAFARNAVAASTDNSRRWDAADFQMTPQGDAEPLKIHTPFFCTKTIGQSTPYPCMKNTLTVTLMANTHFSQDETVISICGLSSAQAENGRMELLDGFAGCGHRHLFSDGPGQQSGFGRWDNTNKCLFLHVVQDTECTTGENSLKITLYKDIYSKRTTRALTFANCAGCRICVCVHSEKRSYLPRVAQHTDRSKLRG